MADKTLAAKYLRPLRPILLQLIAVGFGLLISADLWAQKGAVAGVDISKVLGNDSISNRPMVLMVALAAMALVPFVGMMVTSFVKIAVVLSITRQAMGTQQTPPTTVITGLSIILTVYVMMPVGQRIYHVADDYLATTNESLMDPKNVDLVLAVADKAREPLREFLIKNAHKMDVEMFYNVAWRMREDSDRGSLTPTDLIVLVPAFVISELKEAFQIGFIIFVPFLIIDMVVANILMALGMAMLSPTTISLPFKLLLFVLVDGWYLITRGLVLGYL